MKDIVRRLDTDALVDRGAKDRLLWQIPDDAEFICAWADPVNGDTYTLSSQNMTNQVADHLVMALLRRANAR